ncbi:TPA: LPXTG cell wall anchor domain-containing protein [Streptococcus suis]|nr:LPXTG cell wall anchor domain-containing protein [Streptococcus suis]
MQVKKLVKWGVALTSTLVLGGVVGPVGGQLLNASSIVYAQNQESVTAVLTFYDVSDLSEIADRVYIDIKTGESIVYNYPVFDGYTLHEDYDSVLILDYDSVARRNGETIATGFRKVEKPAETPTEQPVEQPVEIPVEQPTEVPVETPTEQPTDKPTDQPISVAIIAISEADGPLSHYYVTLNPGETKTVEAPKVDGYKLDQYAGPTYELTYDYALGLMNSGGSAWVQFWMIKDIAPETPVDQPVEQPVEKPVETPTEQPVETPAGQPTEILATTPIEQPVEQPAEKPVEQPVETPAGQPTETPVEKPVETPTEKPVEQLVETPTDQPTGKPTATSLLAGNTTSKAQTVATTDKKKVDNSTPSTNTVKPEEGSQATAKTLPKTGDSSSILLGLGGFLSGLSGLGLAATSRKRD